MNEVFLIGKIVTDIEFKFMMNSKHISTAMFEIELSNKSRVKVKVYDEIADFVYSKLKRDDIVFINGKLETGGRINCLYVKNIKNTP